MYIPSHIHKEALNADRDTGARNAVNRPNETLIVPKVA
mgnify:CR=1 FL=1|jgi:hypothetical protein